MDSEISITKYSLRVCSRPWVSHTLSEEEYERLDPKLLPGVIDMEKQFDLVVEALKVTNRSILMLGWCDSRDIESWAEGDEPIKSEESIQYTVNGKILTTRESGPYFCFIGSDIMEFLWKMKRPSLVTPPAEYKDRYYNTYQPVALEQLRNMYGVYHFEFDDNNYEGHGYMWYMRPGTITIMNTYGGTVGIFIGTFNRKEYLDFFIGFSKFPLQFQIDNYHELFALPIEATPNVKKWMVERRKPVEIKQLAYRKIY